MKLLNLFLLAICLVPMATLKAEEVTIYSVYDRARLDGVFAPFTKATGIKVNIVDGTSDDLIARLKNEGSATTADLHIDKDLVYNTKALRADLYRPFNSQAISNSISPTLIDQDRKWLTFLYRARVIMYNKNKVDPSSLKNYEDLADSKWKNRLCVRTSTNSYNQALGAFLVKHYGSERALNIFKGWVINFSSAPLKSDRDVINAVANGECDVALANTYYLAPMIKADAKFPVGVVFPNQQTTGTHINGVGIAIVKYAKNLSAANKVLEYLSSTQVQTPLADAFAQYPSNKNALMSQTLREFGAFNEDQTNLSVIGEYVDEAVALMKAAQYN